MKKLKISIAQLPVNDEDIAANVAGIEAAIDRAAAQGADILLTPEGSLSGYHSHFDRQAAACGLARVTARAKAAGLGLALGTCFAEEDGLFYNQLRFYDKDGAFLGFHTKTLLCGTLGAGSQGEINDFAVKPLRTFNFHGITIGGLICNDMWANPQCTPQDDTHLAYKLQQLGAQIIFHAVNGGRDESVFSQVVIRNYHESNLLMRAAGYQVHIATVDNAFPCDAPNACSGGVVSPAGEWALKLPTVGVQQESYTVTLK